MVGRQGEAFSSQVLHYALSLHGTASAKVVIENPALADWLFYHRVMEFVKAFYTGVLGATDYWLRFEWQHCGSPHVHGLAWLPETPDVEQLCEVSDDVHSEGRDHQAC